MRKRERWLADKQILVISLPPLSEFEVIIFSDCENKTTFSRPFLAKSSNGKLLLSCK